MPFHSNDGARDNTVLTEVKDRENREPNMVMFKVPESDNEKAEERLMEDTNMVLKVCQEICESELQEQDIKKVVRLGKKEEGKTRPILICLRDKELKRPIFRNLSKLSEAEEPFKNIRVIHDTTPLERKEAKNLLTQAKEKTQQSEGKWFYKVQGPPWAKRLVRVAYKSQ